MGQSVLTRILRSPDLLNAVLFNRLTEPLHLNALSIAVAIAGSFRTKVAYDLVWRPYHAFCMLKAADEARALGLRRLTAIELGVSTGDGLLNMCGLASKIEKETGVAFDIVGFDREGGLPEPQDYRDHPEVWQTGDFRTDFGPLQKQLPPNARLVLGDVTATVPNFISSLSRDAPCGFISLDLDYYSSSKAALNVLSGDPSLYLPWTVVYCDDIVLPSTNRWCGELLAIDEFNSNHAQRKLEPWRFVRTFRIFKNARWLDQIYFLHVLDHPRRQPAAEPLDQSYFRTLYG